MALGSKLTLRTPSAAVERPVVEPWPVLVVDDDPQVHEMTRILLRDFTFEDRPFHMLSAYSAQQAREILRDQPSLPVVLLDVVMESPDAGLGLVHTIRRELGNKTIRIVLRTGQPGEAPEREVILAYDINDYKSKAELTAQKMFTALVAAIRNWRDIITIHQLNSQLSNMVETLEEKVADRTRQLQEHRDALLVAKERTETALAREVDAKQQLRHFLSMVSHEFRTPLAIIDSSAQMIAYRLPPSEQALTSRLETIRAAVQRLISLIETCLADDQLEQGRMLLHECMVGMPDLLRAVVEQQQCANPERLIILDNRAPDAFIWADPKLLSLAFGNVINNAVKYSHSGPIQVIIEQQGSALRVHVQDQGMGIPPDDQGQIFNRFFRASNSATVPGSGIGLHMVRQIIQLHDGQIFLDSRVGVGTTITVQLIPDHRRPVSQG